MPEVEAVVPAGCSYCPWCYSNAVPEISDNPSKSKPGIHGGGLHFDLSNPRAAVEATAICLRFETQSKMVFCH